MCEGGYVCEGGCVSVCEGGCVSVCEGECGRCVCVREVFN